MIKAYFRCNGGDYFDGLVCPFDGWSCPKVQEFQAALSRLIAKEQPLSIDAFRMQGVSAATLSQIIVVDFGSDAAAFEALSPGSYVKDGEERRLGNFGPEFT